MTTVRRARPAVSRWIGIFTRIALMLALALGLLAGASRAADPPAPPGQATQDLPPSAARPGVKVSLAEVFFVQRHPATGEMEWLGSAIIWFLLLMSAVSMALMTMLALENRRALIAPETLMNRALSLLSSKRAHELEDFTREDQSYFARVLVAALAEKEQGYAAMLRTAEDMGQELALKRLRRIEPLNIFGNVAPMIGLFGTVYGMIVAFQEIVAAGGTPDPVNLAAGIGTALVTTFWGLVVAIPAISAYALLRTRIDELTAEGSRRVDEALEPYRPNANPPPEGA